MSTVRNVEENVVKMTFDNKDFDKNVKESQKSVGGFNTSLNDLKNTAIQVPVDIMSGLARVLQRIDIKDLLGISAAVGGFALIKKGIGEIGDEIGSVADKALGKINQVMTAAMNQIKTGGKARAENIQQAKFMIEGLELDVETFMEAADYAVKDTAYGLDAAAKAAAQFGASGVTSLEKLKYSLRGISGVASMTSSSYEEIAHIFTTIAGNGRLMTEQMNSLSIKGLNVASTLGKAMNKTEAEIRDMVSKGQISFDMFAKAMDDTFGEHAKEANKTFSGVMSNVRAALSKIGAEFYGPLISDTLGFLDKLRAGLNKFKTTLGDYGVYESFQKAVANISKTLENFTVMFTEALDTAYGGESLMYEISALAQTIFGIVERVFDAFSMKYSFELTKIIVGITDVVWGIRQFIQIMESAVDEVFGITNIGSAFKGLIDLVGELLQEIGLIFYSDEYSKDGIRGYDAIREVFVSWLTTIKEIATTIKDILGINSDNIKTLFKDVVHNVFDFFTNLKISDDEIKKLTRTASGLASVVDIVRMFAVQLFEFLKPALGIIRPLVDGLLEGTATLGDWLTNLRNTIKEEQVFERVFEKLGNMAKFLKDILAGVKNTFVEVFFGEEAQDSTMFSKIIKFISGIFTSISDALGKVDFSKLNLEPLQKMFENLSGFGSRGESKTTLFDVIKEKLAKVGEFFSKIKEWFSGNKDKTITDADKEKIEENKKNANDIIDLILKFVNGVVDAIKKIKIDPRVLLAGAAVLIAIVTAIGKFLEVVVKCITVLASIAIVAITIHGVTKTISDTFSGKGLFDKFTATLNSATANIASAAKNLNLQNVLHGKETFSKVVDAIRGLLLSVVGSIALLSIIPKENLQNAMIALGLIFVMVIAFVSIMAIFASQLFPELTDLEQNTKQFDKLGFKFGKGEAESETKETSSSSKRTNPLGRFAELIKAISTGILEIAAALWIVNKIGSWKEIGVSLGALVVMVGVIAASIAGFGFLMDNVDVSDWDLLAIGAAFLMLSTSIGIIASALAFMGRAIDPKTAALSALVVAGVLAAVAAVLVGVTLLAKGNEGTVLTVAGAVLLMSIGLFTALKSVMGAVKELAKIDDPEKISTIIKGLVGVIVAVGAIAAVLFAVGGIVGNLGPQALIGMAIIAAAILEFGLILMALNGTIASVSGVIKSWSEAIKALKEILEMAKDMSDEDAEGIADRLGKIFGGIAKGIIKGLFSFDNASIDVMSDFIPKLIDFFAKVILPAIGTVLTQIVPDVWNQIIKFIETVITLISQTPMDKIQPIFDFLLVVFDQLLGFLFNAIGTLLDNLNENIPMLEEKIFLIVMNIIETFNRLMEENQDAVQKEITQLINNLTLFAAMAMLADENVEVIWTTAAAIIDTMVYAIAQGAVKLGEVMQKLARFAIASFFLEWNTFGLFDSEWMFDEMFDQDDFKITPTLDLTQIKAGKAELNDIMANRSAYQYEGVFAANNSPYDKRTQSQMNTNALRGSLDSLKTEFGNMMKNNKTTLDLNFSSDAYGQLQILNQEDFIMSGAGWN